MVFGCDHDVFHSGVLCQQYDFLRIEIDRVELPGYLLVIFMRYACMALNLFTQLFDLLPFPHAGRTRIDAPVDEHSKFHLFPLLEGKGPDLAFILRLVHGLTSQRYKHKDH